MNTEFIKIYRKQGKLRVFTYFVFKCKCGKVFEKRKDRLFESDMCRSCRNSISKTIHGMKGTPEYRSWRNMFKRCRTYHLYVEKGICVCERWKNFKNFYQDMGDKPSKKHSI
ncbi:MAG: hypothetical protein KC684_00760, partial [Candidatus Omnitrophica bacterium]|nr:hypothetical protein [Candidatus Omnitrophota bacterium]